MMIKKVLKAMDWPAVAVKYVRAVALDSRKVNTERLSVENCTDCFRVR